MIPSRGLRWSGHAIGIGRRRLLAELGLPRAYSTTPISSPPRRIPEVHLQYKLQQSWRPRLAGTSAKLAMAQSKRFNSTVPSVASPEAAAAVPNAAPLNELSSSLDGVITNLSAIPERIGFLKEMGLDYGWGPTAFIEWLVEHVHVWSGTPWWASIVLTAILVRVALIKPYLNASDTAARLASVKDRTTPITKRMTELSSAGDRAGAMLARAELQKLHKEAGINVLKSFVPLIQIPLGYGTFRFMRGAAGLPVPGLETGGVAWFTDLTISDPYFIMPFAAGATFYYVMKKGGEMGTMPVSPVVQKLMTYGLPSITVLFMATVPACLQLSFFVSSLLSFAQATCFRNVAFRRWAGIAPLPLPKTKENPFAVSNRLNIAPTYQPPSSISAMAAAAKPKGVIGGAVSEVKGMVSEAKKSVNQFAGAEAKKPGVRSPLQMKQASAREERLKKDLLAKRFAEEEERREQRRAKLEARSGRK